LYAGFKYVGDQNHREKSCYVAKCTTDPLEKRIMSALNENKYRYHASNTGKVYVSTMSFDIYYSGYIQTLPKK
jgi:hypothetical protein